MELAYLGIPCTVIPSSKIQDKVAQELAKHVNNRVLVNSWTADSILDHVKTALYQQKNNHRRMFHPEIDGLGAKRIIKEVLNEYTQY